MQDSQIIYLQFPVVKKIIVGLNKKILILTQNSLIPLSNKLSSACLRSFKN